MAKQFDELQLLRSIIEQTGNEGEGSAEQTVLDIVTWLAHQSPASDAYGDIFDIVAKNHTLNGNLWSFDDE